MNSSQSLYNQRTAGKDDYVLTGTAYVQISKLQRGTCWCRKFSTHITVLRMFWILVFLAALRVDGQHASGLLSLRTRREEDAPIIDFSTKPLLRRRQRHKLSHRINSFTEDLQVVFCDDLAGPSSNNSKEFVTNLFNSWPMGGKSYSGILVLIIRNRNRIEIEVGDGLAHIMDQEWCRESLYTEVVPNFRKGNYYKGLDKLLDAMEKTLMSSSFVANRRKSKGFLHRLLTVSGLAGLASLLHNGTHDSFDLPRPPKPGYPTEQKGKRHDKTVSSNEKERSNNVTESGIFPFLLGALLQRGSRTRSYSFTPKFQRPLHWYHGRPGRLHGHRYYNTDASTGQQYEEQNPLDRVPPKESVQSPTNGQPDPTLNSASSATRPTKSSGLGGGASWSDSDARSEAAKRHSSSNGGGASW